MKWILYMNSQQFSLCKSFLWKLITRNLHPPTINCLGETPPPKNIFILKNNLLNYHPFPASGGHVIPKSMFIEHFNYAEQNQNQKTSKFSSDGFGERTLGKDLLLCYFFGQLQKAVKLWISIRRSRLLIFYDYSFDKPPPTTIKIQPVFFLMAKKCKILLFSHASR